MNFLIMKNDSQKGVLCVHYYIHHDIETFFVISPLLLLTKTLANWSNKTSVKMQQRNNHIWVKNETSCHVCHSLSLEKWHNTHPSTSDMHQLTRSKTHEAAAPLSLGSYFTSKVDQKGNQSVSKTWDRKGQVPKMHTHAHFCVTSKQLQPCEPKMWPRWEDTGQPGHTRQPLHCCQAQGAALPCAAASFSIKSALLIYWWRYIMWSP